MRISLVNVQFHEGNNMFPPLGVLYVAAALRAAGHRVQVLDGDPWFEEDIHDRVVAFGPALIGLGFLTMTWTRALDLSQRLRQSLPEVFQLVGGPHATADPSGTLSAFPVDLLVVGEGERTAVEVADRLEAGLGVEGIPGSFSPTSGAGPVRPFIEDLDELPFPARDLCSFERYLSRPGLIRGWSSGRHASLMAGRGCRYRCTFCASHLQLGRQLRMRSVANVMAELRHLVDRYQIRGMYWVDDIFTGDKAWVRAFCAALTDSELELEWACQSRVESVDPELLAAMKAAGCVQVDFGVESGSQRVLRDMKKGTAWNAVVEAFELTHAAGLRTGASFILGSPGETRADVEDTLALAEKLGSDWTVFFFSTPYPGTELALELAARRESDSLPAYGEDWNNRQNRMPFDNGGLPPEELELLRRAAQNRHFRSNYLRARNLGYAAQLAAVAASRPRLVVDAARVALRGGRLDDAVEAWFAEDRARVTKRRRGAQSWFGRQVSS